MTANSARCGVDDFLLRAALAGLGVAAVAGPLGSFVVWRRLAYFGDALSHSALVGVALGLAMGVDPDLGIVLVAVGLALAMVSLQSQRQLASDTLLGIFAHSGLSLGLIAIALADGLWVDLNAYLFGDLLAVTTGDLYWIYGSGAVTLVVLGTIWRPLLASTVHEELSRVEGVPVVAVRLVFMLLIALLIASAMKVVGALLITSLLIIPAATARVFARTPEQMALLAVVAGACAVTGGLAGSLGWDTPAGPSVVVAAALLFVVTRMLAPLARKFPRAAD